MMTCVLCGQLDVPPDHECTVQALKNFAHANYDRLASLERELAEAREKHGEVLRVLHLERSVGQKCACGEIVRQRMSATRELRHAFGIGDYDGVDEGQRKAIEGMRKLRAEVEAAARWCWDAGKDAGGDIYRTGDCETWAEAWSRYQQERKA